ncbi:hypothetical protein NST08_05005 [Paenibacillus sp. FSL K6-1566]|uniref:hypothetical protein n=1 Tax=Paenibacillus sp. FSL K6-1566 TaxID=2954515 RepID=UPI00310194A9
MKKLLTVALTMVMMMTLSISAFASSPGLEIEEKSNSSVNSSETHVNIVNDEVEVFARYNIDWNIPAGYDEYGVSQFSMSKGNTVEYSISWSPRAGLVRVGLYDRNSGNFYWEETDSRPPLSGKITVPYTSVWSLAVGNLSDQRINATGYFIY